MVCCFATALSCACASDHLPRSRSHPNLATPPRLACPVVARSPHQQPTVTMGVKDTALFRKAARKAFDEIDMDKTGSVDYKEVCIGILKIYDSLNAKLPAHVPAPKRQDVMVLCAKYDKDGNGAIEFDEFLEMAKVLVGSRKNFTDSIPWKFGSVLTLKILVCPLLALAVVKGVHNSMGEEAGKRIPQAPLAAVLEMAIKYFLP